MFLKDLYKSTQMEIQMLNWLATAFALHTDSKMNFLTHI